MIQFLDERLPDRFWSKVAPCPMTGCWLWTGVPSSDYGRYRVAGVRMYAHRQANEILVGPIAADLQIDHLCRIRCCVNPTHLEPVTQRVNILRGTSPLAVLAAKTS